MTKDEGYDRNASSQVWEPEGRYYDPPRSKTRHEAGGTPFDAITSTDLTNAYGAMLRSNALRAMHEAAP